MTERCSGSALVVGVTELIAALVPIHSMLAFLADMYCLFDLLENRTGSLSINIALDQLIILVLLSHVVSQGGFVVF